MNSMYRSKFLLPKYPSEKEPLCTHQSIMMPLFKSSMLFLAFGNNLPDQPVIKPVWIQEAVLLLKSSLSSCFAIYPLPTFSVLLSDSALWLVKQRR